MATLLFLDLQQCQQVLLAELPAGVFATDFADHPEPALRSYSSAEVRTVATIYALLYGNLAGIWENKFLTLVLPDGIGKWESELFTSPADATLPFETRQQNLITKFRATGGLSYPYINGLVASILEPLDLDFFLACYSGAAAGAWLLDVTPLDQDTYLAELDPLQGAIVGQYDLDCNSQLLTNANTVETSFIVSGIAPQVVANIQIGAGVTGKGIPDEAFVVSKSISSVTLDVAASSTVIGTLIQIANYRAAQLTQADFQSIQTTAYTYAVYIYGNASAHTLSTLKQTLNLFQPAGMTFEIFNNVASPMGADVIDLGGGSKCAQVDSIDCGYGLVGATYDLWDMAS